MNVYKQKQIDIEALRAKKSEIEAQNTELKQQVQEMTVELKKVNELQKALEYFKKEAKKAKTQ